MPYTNYDYNRLYNIIKENDFSQFKDLMNQEPNVKSDFWFIALNFVCTAGTVQYLKFMVDKGVDVSAYTTPNNDTALHFAAAINNAPLCSALINYDANINATNNAGETPLYKAAAEGRLDSIKVLLDHHANIGVKNN